jgi:NADH-quinone oxidoreductase subunit H
MTPFALVTYYEPRGIQIIKALVIFGVAFAILPMLTVYERKLLGRFQGRYGPNRVGPFGLLQPIAEIVKFATKEPSRPTTSVGYSFRIAPIIAILTAIGGLALIPFGDVQHVFGKRVGLYGIDVSVGPLYVFALAGSRFTGSCSAAGRLARSTRSSARCVAPRSSSLTRFPRRWRSSAS